MTQRVTAEIRSDLYADVNGYMDETAIKHGNIEDITYRYAKAVDDLLADLADADKRVAYRGEIIRENSVAAENAIVRLNASISELEAENAAETARAEVAESYFNDAAKGLHARIATLEAQLADARAENEKLRKEIIRCGMQTLATLSKMGIEFSEAISAAQAAALEEAAKALESRAAVWREEEIQTVQAIAMAEELDEQASAIRDLKPKGPQG